MEEEAKHPVRTVEKSLRLIEELKSQEGGRVSELADGLDMGVSGVHNHLNTLKQHGYVIQDGEEYRLSLKLFELGGFVRNQMDLFRVAEPEVKQLAEETGERVNLITEERGIGVYLKQAKGPNAVDVDTYPGVSVHLHSTSLGKAVLAHLPPERVDEIIDFHGLPKHTDRTITDADELKAELAEIRERGYAIDEGERVAGLRCMSAPILRDEDTVAGSISVTTPTSRWDRQRFEEELPTKVKGSANVIELNLRY
jgi:IclR family acetate operon transcriptional repressor